MQMKCANPFVISGSKGSKASNRTGILPQCAAACSAVDIGAARPARDQLFNTTTIPYSAKARAHC